jgi:hypothetical protein
MRTGLFLSREQIEVEQLRAFVEAIGGEWRTDYGISQGIVQRGKGTVFVTHSPQELGLYDDVEWTNTIALVGFCPVSAVSLGITSHVESLEVAYDVVQAIRNKWNGAMDWDDEAIAAEVNEAAPRRDA